MGGEMLNEDLNVFLRSKKVLQVEQHLVAQVQGAVWTFVIRYVEDHSPIQKNKEKIDYRLVLTEAAFGRYSQYREIRKAVAQSEGLPAFAVFTDEEMAEMAKLEVLTAVEMKKIKGIGEKKTEKYAAYFIPDASHAKSE